MNECVFCKIIEKKIPAEIIYEDSELISFLDINPVNFGHLLLIPKKHFPLMDNVPDELISKLFIKTKELMKKLKTAMNADFIVISIVGIDIPHFHVHIIPRYYDDGLAKFWPTKKYKNEQMKTVANKIKRAEK